MTGDKGMKIETAIEWGGIVTVSVTLTLLLVFVCTLLVKGLGWWFLIGIVTLMSAPLWLGVIIWLIANKDGSYE